MPLQPNAIPGYEILKPLGNGGMSTLYVAKQQSLQREVAIKVFWPDQHANDASFADRFEQEARIASKLNHQNIVTVIDYGNSNQGESTFYYLVMTLIEGSDLTSASQKMSLIERLKVIQQIAEALDYAHAQGIVHRDIKPQNILIQADTQRALLTDFGIAKGKSNPNLTQTGMTLGTPHYMSPEQALGKSTDGRSDIYSLGVVLYYLLTGKVPFEGDSEVAIGIKHVTEPLPLLPKQYQCFQKVMAKALAKSPDDRFSRASELADAISHISIDNIKTIVKSLNHISDAPTRVTKSIRASEGNALSKRSTTLSIFAALGLFIAGLTIWLLFEHSETTGEIPVYISSDQESQAEGPIHNQPIPNVNTTEIEQFNTSNASPHTEARDSINATELRCTYLLTNDWGHGWQGNITLTNRSNHPIKDWQINFSVPSTTQITQSFITQVEQLNGSISFKPHDWNRTIEIGQQFELGFQGSGIAPSKLINLTCNQ